MSKIQLTTASPFTKRNTPSIEEKKSLSSKRSCFCFSTSIAEARPDTRSASSDICLPGRASKINLARTSATLSDPLAMTRKFTKKNRQQAAIPAPKLPKEKKFPKEKIIGDAQPEDKINRVEARFNPKRNKQRYTNNAGKSLASRLDFKENTQNTTVSDKIKLIHKPVSKSS
ncbi:Uncharacterised protein [Chlamydia abortus]|nr:Uncharacterised protein [Chlamydia abortus]